MNRNLLIAVVAMFIVGAGAGMGIAKLRKPAAPAAAHAAVAEPSAPVTFDELLVNLADKDQAHYLKVQVVLMVKGVSEGHGGGLEAETPQIRDAMIMTMSQRTFRELLAPEGKTSLKKSLRQRVNGVLKDDRVTDVYFTSFAMQ